jgi:hypothetical protein
MGPQLPLKLDMLVRGDAANGKKPGDPVDVLWDMRTRINNLQEELARKAANKAV